MTGYSTMRLFRRVEKSLAALGLRLADVRSNYGDDSLIVIPLDDNLPIYRREAEITAGSLESINAWCQGVEWARGYDDTCGLKTDQRRAKAEQRVLENRLMRALKTGEQEDV